MMFLISNSHPQFDLIPRRPFPMTSSCNRTLALMTEDVPQQDAAPKTKGDHLSKNKKLFADKSLFKDEWLTCFDKPSTCVFACCFPCTVMCTNFVMSGPQDAKIVNCLLGWFCGCCLCGIIRSATQNAIGVTDDGFVWNCLMHFCLLSPPSLVQENRALVRWKKATDDTFKEKYKKSGKYFWDIALAQF